MLTSSSVGDPDWDDPALSSEEDQEHAQRQSNAGTVFQNNQTTKSNKWKHLNDLFEYPSNNRLSDIFTKQDESNAVKAKDLFSVKHDTLTKRKLKSIIDSMNSSDVFKWPEEKIIESQSLVGLPAIDPKGISADENVNVGYKNDTKEDNALKNDTLANQQNRRPKSTAKLKNPSTLNQPQEINNHSLNSVEVSGCLDLSGCGLNSIIDRKVEGKIYTKFKLNHNYLEFLDEIDSTAQLLLLSNNSLSDMTSFSHLQSLSHLDISNNALTDLSGFCYFKLALSSLSGLKELKASHNKVTDILPLRHLHNLVHVDLKNNVIGSLDFIKSSFPRLYTLSMAGNRISKISNLSHLKYLHELYLEDNILTHFEVGASMKRLKILNLSDNFLTEFSAFNFPALGVLQLDRNRINLVKGNLTGLDVFSIEDQASASLTFALERSLVSEEIRVSGNKNLIWDTDFCKNCESFDSSYCSLPGIPLSLLNSLNLRNLSLTNNQIIDISPIKGLKNLRVLLLSNNLLKDFHGLTETLKEFNYLSILDITNNPFISPDADKLQMEVSEIVMNTCVLIACKQLKNFNRVSVSPVDRKRASKRMNRLKEVATNFSQKSKIDLFQDWKPDLHPLEDMTAGEELVLEIL